MDQLINLEDRISILSPAKTVYKTILRKKINKRRSYLIKTNFYRERHGVRLKFSNIFHRNYFDRLKMHRISKSNQGTSTSLGANSYASINYTENGFRDNLNPQDKFFNDKKMENNKNISPEEIITKVRKIGLKGDFFFSKVKRKLVLKKGFSQKYIATFVKDLNPIQDIRVSEYVFPLESELQKADSHLEFSACYHQFKIKRATQLTFDPKDSFYRAKLEERYPSTEEFSGINIVNYYCKWLDSLCDYRANNLKNQIEKFIKSMSCPNSQVQKSIDKKLLISEQQLHNQKKMYLSKLSDETRNYISDRPTCVRCNRLDRSSSQKTVYECRINQKWANLIGINTVDLNFFDYRNMAPFTKYVRSDNQIELYCQILFDMSSCVTEKVSTDTCVVIPNNQIYYVNIRGEKN